MNEQLNRIKEKIVQLRKLDRNFILFGSVKHRYKLNPTISKGELRQFEETHKIIFPKGYARFLIEIGNGGIGPFYGLESLENTLYEDLDFKRPEFLLNPGKPFPHTVPWNLSFQATVDEEKDEEQYEAERQKFEEKYYDNEQRNGVLAICNYGCAISLNLVVNGEEYGNIWTDDRASDNGIHPSRELGNTDKISFLDWYELWLDNSINEIKNTLSFAGSSKDSDKSGVLDKKPWWKLFLLLLMIFSKAAYCQFNSSSNGSKLKSEKLQGVLSTQAVYDEQENAQSKAHPDLSTPLKSLEVLSNALIKNDSILVSKVVTREGYDAIKSNQLFAYGRIWLAILKMGEITSFHSSKNLQILHLDREDYLLSFILEENTKEWKFKAFILHP